MIYVLDILDDAADDIQAIIDYYEFIRLSLARDFELRLQESFDLILYNPEIYAVGYRRVRRYKITRFPFVVYYRIASNSVEIVAVVHAKRSSRIWKSRL